METSDVVNVDDVGGGRDRRAGGSRPIWLTEQLQSRQVEAFSVPSPPPSLERSGRVEVPLLAQPLDTASMATVAELVPRPHRAVLGIRAAKASAPRQAALIVGWQPETALLAAGFDLEASRGARAASNAGARVTHAVERLPQSVANALVISGTLDECLSGVHELLKRAVGAGFTQVCIGAPAGPQPAEAIQLLTDIILPELSRA